MVHDLSNKSFAEMLSKAFQNVQVLKYPEYLKPVRKGETVVGVLNPSMQALFLLTKKLEDEVAALETSVGHGGLPCPVCAHSEQLSAAYLAFFTILRTTHGKYSPFGPGYEIRADWQVVEVEAPFEGHFRKMMARFTREGSGSSTVH